MSDNLTVVTVTYSPGPHLRRFLTTMSHATERSSANLGYGTAVNRAVAELGPEADFFKPRAELSSWPTRQTKPPLT